MYDPSYYVTLLCEVNALKWGLHEININATVEYRDKEKLQCHALPIRYSY